MEKIDNQELLKQNLIKYVMIWKKYNLLHDQGLTMQFNYDEIGTRRAIDPLLDQKSPQFNEEIFEFVMSFSNNINNVTEEEVELKFNQLFNVKQPEPTSISENSNSSKLVTLDEIKNYQNIISSMSKEDSNKLNYLINNYKKLNIKYINLDTLTYIDESNQERQILKTDIEVLSSKDEEDFDDKTFINEALEITKKNEEANDISKVKDKPKQSGYISAIFLFVLTAFTGGILATILTLILSR